MSTANTYDRNRFDSWVRVVLMALVGTIAALAVVLGGGGWLVAPAAGWAAAAGTFLLVIAVTIGRIPPAQTAAHATREDGSRTASHVLVTVATIASFGAVALLLIAAGTTSGATRIWMVA